VQPGLILVQPVSGFQVASDHSIEVVAIIGYSDLAFSRHCRNSWIIRFCET